MVLALTKFRQFYHTDGTDLVGLLCIAKALEGGESDIVSTQNVFNTLQREHPDVVETMCSPNWYFDRKGEVSEGDEPWYKSSIFFMVRVQPDIDGRSQSSSQLTGSPVEHVQLS